MEPNPDSLIEKIFVRTLMTFLSTACVLAAAGALLYLFLPSYPTTAAPEIAALFVRGSEGIWFEPTERTLFLSLTLLAPFAILFFNSGYWDRFFSRTRLNEFRIWKYFFTALITVSFVICAGAGVTRLFLGRAFQHGYFAWIVSLLLCLFAAVDHIQALISPGGSPKVRRAIFLFALPAAAYFVFTWRWFGASYVVDTVPFNFHFSAVFYAVTQSVAGKVPFHDFTSLYGLFGEILAPWLRLIGFSVSSFTFTMAALQFVSLASVLWFAYKTIPNAFLLAGALPSVILAAQTWAVGKDAYIQYWPVRFLFPALSLPLFLYWNQDRSRLKWLLISLFSGLALVWNLDSGVAVAGAFIGIAVFNSELDVHIGEDGKSRSSRLLNLVLDAALFAALAAVVVFLFLLEIRLRSGAWPLPADLFKFQGVFYSLGYFMMPMPRFFHPWQVIVAIYLLGLSLSIAAALNVKRLDPARLGSVRTKAGAVFFLTILGIGLFPYYQGRSHDNNLLIMLWPATVLFFMLTGFLLESDGRRKLPDRVAQAPVVIACLCGCLAFFSLAEAVLPLAAYAVETHKIRETEITVNAKFITSELNGERECAILSRLQAIYFAECLLASSLKGTGVDDGQLILKRDLDMINDQLAASVPKHLFIESYWLPSSDQKFERGLRDLEKRYTLAAVSPTGHLRHYIRKAL